MKWQKTIQLVEVHCEGETGSVITSGVIDVPGMTMVDKMNYLNAEDDSLLRFVLFEPRGCAQMAANLLLPPTNPEADVGVLILHPDGVHPMSGSNCMCVVTAILETGILSLTEPSTDVVLDTPAGLVNARAHCGDGRCERVELAMTPAFVEELDVKLTTKQFGDIVVDVAYGGEYYALIDVEQLGIRIEPESAKELVMIGAALKKAISEKLEVCHPTISDINEVANVMFRDRDEDGFLRTCTTGGTGRVDRSPCGTGNTANLAVLYQRGELSKGDRITVRSIIGSEFELQLIDETTIDQHPGVAVTVSGRSWIYGFHQIGLDPTDPFRDGFMLSDTWGPDIRL